MTTHPSATALKIARKYLREIDANDFGTPDGHDIDHCASIVDAGLAEVREALEEIKKEFPCYRKMPCAHCLASKALDSLVKPS